MAPLVYSYSDSESKSESQFALKQPGFFSQLCLSAPRLLHLSHEASVNCLGTTKHLNFPSQLLQPFLVNFRITVRHPNRHTRVRSCKVQLQMPRHLPTASTLNQPTKCSRMRYIFNGQLSELRFLLGTSGQPREPQAFPHSSNISGHPSSD